MTFRTLTEIGEIHSPPLGVTGFSTVWCWQCGWRSAVRSTDDPVARLTEHVRHSHPDVEIPDPLTIEEG